VEEEWISILGNYSLHYVGDGENGTISADYFGVFSNALKEKLAAGDGCVGIMSNGTSGDGNIWELMDSDNKYPKQLFEKSKYIGEDLADRVLEVVPGLVWDEHPNLLAAYDTLEIPRRIPQPDELQKAKAIVSEGGFEGLIPDAE